MQVSIHGSYYGNNFGDMLLLSLYVRWIRECTTNVTINLPLASATNRQLLGADTKGIVKALFGGDALLYAGGGYFGEPEQRRIRWTIRNYARHVFIGKLFKMLNRPIAIIGVGAGPVSGGLLRRNIVDLCNYASTLVVRDHPSRSFLVKYGVPANKISVATDAALTIRREHIPEQALLHVRRMYPCLCRQDVIGVHLSHVRGYSNGSSVLFDDIVAYARSNPERKFLLLVDGISRRRRKLEQECAAIELLDALGDQALLSEYSDPWILIAVLSRLKLVVTTKLHVGIASVALGTPVVSFPYHQKTPRFFSQLGASERCRSISTLRAGEAAGLIEKFYGRRDGSKIADALARTADINKSAVFDFVSGSEA
jgi:polysaccharide pyruvyl transferase WcaK-like protein